ncbi:hypothetical protein F1C16_16145 [Hymenobacter sp. NBH84]|uniref:hypothetical protein n=1 Tax=Hymenobacter sp. NBH84 TaxID=2596915 RepID=UPI001626E426|nr:hypothetical protein [Hymenobacter sp. NBH84]QNE40987.1 hypothetical protein F1C16_16145 [Hymenobacter sp. NBH84]
MSLLLLLALLPFLLLCFYNQPYLDDYIFAVVFREHGVWDTQAFMYQYWNGRYIASFLLTVCNPLSYGWQSGIWLANLTIISLTLAALWGSIRSLTGRVFTTWQVFMLTVGLFLVFVAVIPDIQSALYWFSSQATHHIASLLLLVIPVLVVRAHRATYATTRRLWWAAAAGATLFVGGSSELVVTLLGWLFIVAGAVSLKRREHRNLRVWLGLLLLLTIAVLIDSMAPSYMNRLNQNSNDVAASLPAKFLAFWNPAWLMKALQLLLWQPTTLLLLVVPLLLQPWATRLAKARPAGFRLPLGYSAVALLAGVFWGAFLMQIEIATQYIVARCANVLLWWMLLGWLAACWAALPASPTTGNTTPLQTIRHISLLLLCVVVAAPIWRAWRELLVEAPTWSQQMEQRYTALRRIAHQAPHTNVEFPPIRHVVPRYVLIRGYDILPVYNTPYNRYMSSYFGVDSVRVDPTEPNAAFLSSMFRQFTNPPSRPRPRSVSDPDLGLYGWVDNSLGINHWCPVHNKAKLRACRR